MICKLIADSFQNFKDGGEKKRFASYLCMMLRMLRASVACHYKMTYMRKVMNSNIFIIQLFYRSYEECWNMCKMKQNSKLLFYNPDLQLCHLFANCKKIGKGNTFCKECVISSINCPCDFQTCNISGRFVAQHSSVLRAQNLHLTLLVTDM